MRKRPAKRLYHCSGAGPRREKKPLDPVASERLDRIASVSHLVEEVFENRETAARWMLKSNKTLGAGAPVTLCKTESGASQVRRVLLALSGGRCLMLAGANNVN